jgi:hypothetical protein
MLEDDAELPLATETPEYPYFLTSSAVFTLAHSGTLFHVFGNAGDPRTSLMLRNLCRISRNPLDFPSSDLLPCQHIIEG